MDVEDAVLSDAMVGVEAEDVGETIGENQYNIVRTRYEFWNMVDEDNAGTSGSDPEEDGKVDSEGDLKVRRRPKCRDFLTIDHAMATTLDDVGLQIWHGALLLCDYVLYIRNEIRHRVVLELGCGAGVTAIVAALAEADTVYATDSDPKTLQLVQRNVELNRSLLPNGGICVKPRSLKWCNPLSNSISQWPLEDQDVINRASIILAADVIYDSILNETLFATIQQLCDNMEVPKTVLVSIEKRYNFTLSEMNVACPAYSHFLNWIANVEFKGWNVEKIDTSDVPICFSYKRNSDMELWKLYIVADPN